MRNNMPGTVYQKLHIREIYAAPLFASCMQAPFLISILLYLHARMHFIMHIKYELFVPDVCERIQKTITMKI